MDDEVEDGHVQHLGVAQGVQHGSDHLVVLNTDSLDLPHANKGAKQSKSP